jgi:leucyl aminopeptidase (aminopeptidase T)
MSETAVANVEKALQRNAREGDRILIVIDSGVEPEVAEIIASAAERFGADHDVLTSAPAPAPNAEPVAEVAAAILEHDLSLLATSVPIAHTDAVRRGVAAGGRFLIMDGVSPDMLEAGAAAADYERVHEVGLAVEARWNEAEHVRVTSEFGTEFEADIRGRESWRWDGTVFEADWFGLTGCAFPDGEVGIAPLEGSANGKVVWDASVHSLGLLEEPVSLTVEDGWITSIDGGAQAEDLATRIAALDDRNSYYCPAEIAIGINEAARITGSLREDKKALGTVHIASGTNLDLGGTIEAKSHIDGLIRTPTLWMDGELVVESGVIVPALLQ